jgi:hypothetical protein
VPLCLKTQKVRGRIAPVADFRHTVVCVHLAANRGNVGSADQPTKVDRRDEKVHFRTVVSAKIVTANRSISQEFLVLMTNGL